MSGDMREEKEKDEQKDTGGGLTRRKFIQSVGLGSAGIGVVSVVSSARAAEKKGAAKSKTTTGGKKKKLKLTVAFSENPRLLPLKEGIVQPEHIELEFETMRPNEIFLRNLSQGMKTDVSEMSLSETLLARDRKDIFGKGRWEWTAIPTFLSRGLFWAELYVNNASGINGLGDLKGKKIGVPDYCMTAALWFKITLKDLYGIEARDNVWYNNRTRAYSHGGMLGLGIDEYGVTEGVKLTFLPVDQAIDVLLERGELDAAFPPDTERGVTLGNTSVLDRYGGTQMTNNPRIRRLLSDSGEAAIFEFFRKTGCHQPNHHVIIKNEILAEHPWVAMELMDAFRRSKEVAYEQARKTRGTYLIFEPHYWREQAAVLGQDPYPLGVKAMRKTIERAIRGSMEQGLIRKPLKVEDLYFRTTLDT
jgi:4,5-dihydroxyphthalate decarboxylase